MVLTRSQLRAKERFVAPIVFPLRIQRGSELDESPVEISAKSDSVAGFDNTDSMTEPRLNVVTKPRRVRRELEYKSIVRTRLQKLKEAEAFHESQLTKLQEFWTKWRKEPNVDSADTEEVALASYIHNLRTVAPGNFKPEFVARVTEMLPWFKWSIQEKPRSSFIDNLLAFSLLFMLIATATQMQILLNNKDALYRILRALSHVSSVRAIGFM